jgi:hypothetical protein
MKEKYSFILDKGYIIDYIYRFFFKHSIFVNKLFIDFDMIDIH